MSNNILISVTRDEIRVGLVENGQVVELYIERKRNESVFLRTFLQRKN